MNPSNPGVNMRYKTQLCRHFENLGKCQVADRCQFAHGQAELRTQNQPLTEQQIQNALKAQQSQVQPMHQRQQNQNYNKQNYSQGGAQGQNNSNFKTVKCKFFESPKGCPYKERCSFAHGDQELRVNHNNMQQQQQQFQQHQQQYNPQFMQMPHQMAMYQNQMPNMMVNPQYIDPATQQQMMMLAANQNMFQMGIDPNQQAALMQQQGIMTHQYQPMMMQQQPLSPEQMAAQAQQSLKIQGNAMIDPSQQQPQQQLQNNQVQPQDNNAQAQPATTANPEGGADAQQQQF